MVRQLVGHCAVDHGGVCVLDPLFAEITEDDNDRICEARPGTQLNCGEERIEHVGVYVTTGLGDGSYPVYADVIEVPDAGKRVARIVIDCLGVEPESEDLRGYLVAATDQLNATTGWSVRVDDDVRRRALGEPA
jgi:hypothetical protein